MAKSKKSPAATPPPAVVVGGGQLLLVLAVVVVLAGGAWYVLRGRGGAPTPAPPAAQQPGVDALAGKTADGDPTLGPATAPVTLEVFSDFQCPNCRQFATEVLPWMRQTWLPKGFVRVVFHDFAARGPESVRAAEAAHCAGDQGQFWPYHDRLFAAQEGENKGTFSDERLAAEAAALGLDPTKFSACLTGGQFRSKVEAATKAAKDKGFQGTPTYLVNGRETRGAIPVAEWDKLFQLYAAELGGAAAKSTPASPW